MAGKKTLVIAEKPSAGRDIFSAMESTDIAKSKSYQEGTNYIVTWGFGHLAGHCEPEAYGWKDWTLEDQPMVPQEWKIEPVASDAEALKGVKAQLELIKKLASRKDVDRIVNATDAEREGELIFYFIEQHIGMPRLGKPVLRLWTQGTTIDAYRDAFRQMKPRDVYAGYLEAGLCRAKADWVLGLSGTRAMTIVMRALSSKLRLRVDQKAVWSVGRVQTPVVAMVVDRFRAHEDFVPTEYFRIRGLFQKESGEEFDGLWFRGEQRTIETKGEAEGIAREAKAGPIRVVSVEQKPKKVPPQCLFSQNAIQKEANRRFGFSLDKTLAVCQKLYERKFISYPRSPSNVIPPEMVPELWMHLEAFDPNGPYGAAAARAKERDPKTLGSRFVKASAAAHFALIPLPHRKWEDQAEGDKGPLKPVPVAKMRQDISQLSPDEVAIYDLITRRFLAMFWPDAMESVTAVVVGAGEETFRTSGTVIDDPGWYDLDPPYGGKKGKKSSKRGGRKAKDDDDDEPAEEGEDGKPQEEDGGKLPQLAVGEVLQGGFQVEADKTSPPPLYTEGTLVDHMRTAGKDLDDEMADAMAADGKDGGIGTTATRAATVKELFHKKFIVLKGKKVLPTEKGFALIDTLRANGGETLTNVQLTGEWEMALQEVQAGQKDPRQWFREFLAFTTSVINGVKACFDPAFAKDRVKGVDIGACPKCGDGRMNRYPSDYGGFFAKCSACKAVAGVDEQGVGLILREAPCAFCGAKAVTVGKFGDFCMSCAEPQGVAVDAPCPVCTGKMVGLVYEGKSYVRCTGKGCQVSWYTDSSFLRPTSGTCGACGSPLRSGKKGVKTCVKCGPGAPAGAAPEDVACPKCGSPMKRTVSRKAGEHLRCTDEKGTGCTTWWHTTKDYSAPRHGKCLDETCGAPLRESAERGLICSVCGKSGA